MVFCGTIYFLSDQKTKQNKIGKNLTVLFLSLKVFKNLRNTMSLNLKYTKIIQI